MPQLVPTRRLFVNFAYRLRCQEAPDVVVCDNSAHGLRGRAVIELEHAAEALTAPNRACADQRGLGCDALITEILVGPFLMIVSDNARTAARRCGWRIPNYAAHVPEGTRVAVSRPVSVCTPGSRQQAMTAFNRSTPRDFGRCPRASVAYTSRRHWCLIQPTTVRLPSIRPDIRASTARVGA